jgi:hypothetical protein
MAENREVEQAADELYGLLPAEFTSARDERVKALRADGERDAAAAVKALRKPTVAAWALNQLSRARKKDLDALLSAGEKLRAAQEELLGGGDRSAFQKAAAKERELVARLSGDAVALASEAGERAAGLQEKVSATLHAAALDDETAAELRTGRIVREREAIGGFGEPGGDAASGSGATAPAPGKSSRKAARAPATPRAKAGARDAERRQRLTAAKTDERHARRELEAAERILAQAKGRAEAAAAHAKEAAERATTTAARVKEAARAQAAARKAHARAESALEKAETAGSKS